MKIRKPQGFFLSIFRPAALLLAVPSFAWFRSGSDFKILREALSKHRTEGRTVLYDAVAAALKHLEAGHRDKKTLVIVSDGGDNASKRTLAETMRLIEESHATIYTIGYIPDRGNSKPGLRKIHVIASAPGHGRPIVRTRTSYLDVP